MINALAFLLDQPPGALRAELATPRAMPVTPPAAPVGVPSELARRRPDIRAAEAQLHAATADIGVAVAAFYPTVQLNGGVGFDSLTLPKLWQANSLQYIFGPSIQLPIFNAGRLQNTVELREAQQQEAAITYHRTVLQAWHDVVNALVAHGFEQETPRPASGASRARPPGAGHRPNAATGRASTEYLNVLNAERTALLAEQRLARARPISASIWCNCSRRWAAAGKAPIRSWRRRKRLASGKPPPSDRPERIDRDPSADSWQLFAGEPIDDAVAAEACASSARNVFVFHDMADDRGVAAERMGAHRGEKFFRALPARRRRPACPRWRHRADRGRAVRRPPPLAF